MTFRLSAVEEMTRTAVQIFTPKEFAKYGENVKLEEMNYKEVNA